MQSIMYQIKGHHCRLVRYGQKLKKIQNTQNCVFIQVPFGKTEVTPVTPEQTFRNFEIYGWVAYTYAFSLKMIWGLDRNICAYLG
jgi:hypothetical protein